MIRIKVYKLSQLVGAAVIALLVIAAVIVGICLLTGGDEDEIQQTMSYAASAQVDAAAMPDKPFTWLNASPLSFPDDPVELLSSQLPLAPEAIPVTAENDQADEPDDLERIQVEISKIESSYEPEISADKPRVLIYHTHSYEAFAQDPEDPYVETTAWRTKDSTHNIMGVGAKLTDELEALGIEVVHDLTEHEPPKLGTAYTRSLETLEAYAEAGEEFDIMIDLHRDAASMHNTNPSCVSSGGRDYARLMVLIGNGEGSEGNRFSVKPNWQENYKLARAITDGLNKEIPNICREVMVKTGRYNQHMSESAVLIEVGHNENTLQEALNATEPLAKVIADILLGDDRG